MKSRRKKKKLAQSEQDVFNNKMAETFRNVHSEEQLKALLPDDLTIYENDKKPLRKEN